MIDDRKPPLGHEIDTTVSLITPERITFNYPLAGPFQRLLSYGLDTVIVGFVIGCLLITAALASALGARSLIAIVLIAYFVLQWSYSALFESFCNGQTPGKMVVGLRVLSTNGTSITFGQALLRNFAIAFEGLWIPSPFGLVFPCFIPALVCCCMTRRLQRFGDVLAGTMVVVERRVERGKVPRFADPRLSELMKQMPARFEAGPDLTRALGEYVRKRGQFSDKRREEMASGLAAVLRARFGFPEGVTSDAVLCAVFQKAFHGG